MGLPSVIDVFPSVRPGDELQITVDLATSPGVILQCHPKLEVCFQDIQKIREMEASYLYKVADAKASMVQSQEGCMAMLWRAICCLCSSGPSLNNVRRAVPPSPSVMSPVRERVPVSTFVATTDLDSSSDLDEF